MNVSRLISSDLSVRRLIPVRGDGATIHFARANAKGGIEHAPALCGLEGPLDRYGRPRWRRAHVPGERTCMSCHAESCARPSRVEWR